MKFEQKFINCQVTKSHDPYAFDQMYSWTSNANVQFNFGFLRFQFKTVYCIFVYNQVPDSCSKQGFTFMSDLEMTIYLISWFLRGDMLNVDKRQTEWREVKDDLNPHISQPSCCILNIFKVTHFESKFKFVFEPPPLPRNKAYTFKIPGCSGDNLTSLLFPICFLRGV